MSKPTPPSLKIRIDFDPDEGRIGPGKIRLLETIHACGSIAAAGRAMHMSYKCAWVLLGEINRTCRHEVISGRPGGENGGGAELTPFGLALVERYRNIEQSVANAVRYELLALQADIGAGPSEDRAARSRSASARRA